jgi:hypothetical protein
VGDRHRYTFDFSACYTHNYREFISGFEDWAGEVAESRSFSDYCQKVSPAESASVWQSLFFGANYKAAYCMGLMGKPNLKITADSKTWLRFLAKEQNLV